MSEVLSKSLFLLQSLLPMMQLLGIPSEISGPHLCAARARKPPYPSLLRNTAGLRCGSIRYSRSLPGQPCFGPSSRSQRHKSTWFRPWVLQPFSSFDSLPLGTRLGRTSSYAVQMRFMRLPVALMEVSGAKFRLTATQPVDVARISCFVGHMDLSSTGYPHGP